MIRGEMNPGPVASRTGMKGPMLSASLLLTRAWRIVGILLYAALASCAGGDPGPAVPTEIPVAGPPPEGDLLEPVPNEVRTRSAVQMLLVVVVSLTLIAVLLRLVGRRSRATTTTSEAAVPEDPFERARQALEDMDKQQRQDRRLP